ncbi:hypothetical protein GCM10009641_27960 [Mycobacterium cookii]|uniref:Uncharacterized protein n=1 Tax=Nocardioides furvisabuli TaxID=375542 RepID=A0ABN2XKN2_9ACTN|nr:hypothetical protein [Nocardioides furvisabuli]
MSDPTDLLLRHRAVRWTVLLGVVLAMSLSLAPASHATDGGHLGDLTDVAGAVTEPVVEPVVEPVHAAVQTVVPPVEHAVEPVTAHVVEPALSQVEHAGEAASGGPEDGPVGGASGGSGGGSDDSSGGGSGGPAAGGDGVSAVGSVTGSQPPGATSSAAPAGQGSGDDTGAPGRRDGPGTAVADRTRGGQRPSPASCDGVGDLPARGAATPAVQVRQDVRSSDAAEPGWTDGRSADRSDGFRGFVLPGEGVPAPALSGPDAARALWLAVLVAVAIMLAMGLTVVLARELE